MKSWSEVYLPPIDSKFNFPALHLHDTASGAAEVLPVKDEYRMYVCGITPYDATHLGHAATYLTFDLVNRYLSAMGKKVHYVQNVTDIDDPLLERAQRDGVDWKELAQSQIDLFRGDMSDLHIIPPEHLEGVVESMEIVLQAIQTLDSKGTTYTVEEDLYFDVHSDPDFGSRSHLALNEMLATFAERGGDPDRSGKLNPLDSLLWLHQRGDEPWWTSRFGNGRPGWHIECCAIALSYLNPDSKNEYLIDIQGGGSDLIFPHHEMSAAQAKVITGKEFAQIYLHTGMVGLNGEKMSKSLGNLVFLSKLVQQGNDPMAIRLALISSHYSENRMWNAEILADAINFLDRLRLCLSRPEVAPTEAVIQEMIDLLAADLNTPEILKALKEWCAATEKGNVGGSAGELARAIDLLLGIAI